jgi:uncharacterized protein YyaL (SSP411 family)
MTATQAMTGQGGWPMTVFATPAGQPFFAGTYFPRAAFANLLDAVRDAWRAQRDAVDRQSAQVVTAITNAQLTPSGRGGSAPPDAAALDNAAALLADQFDNSYGGFGGAPKFPPHLALLFLVRQHARTGDPRSRGPSRATGEQMARGGIYDQLGGGFARYSVDGTWTVPHFEKMLYDNALLLRVYTELWRLTGDPLPARVARETVDFLLDGLGTPERGLASALDADTGGVEGATYAWTPAQLRDALDDTDGDWAADLFGVTAAGTFEHGTSVLRLARDADALDDPQRERWQRIRAALRRARDGRPQPARDGKVVAEWNGLAITALVGYARVARAMGAPDARAGAAAIAAGELLRDIHLVDGRLRRVSRDGVVGAPAGVLADYGCVAEGFDALHELTGDGTWLDAAGRLLDTALVQFGDGRGGFYDTAADAEALITRPADPTDNATPSGASAVSDALIAHTALTGDTRYRDAATSALGVVAPIIAKHPRFAGYAAAAAEALLAGPVEVAVAGDTPAERAALVDVAVRLAPPGTVIVDGSPDRPGVPLLAGRPPVDGRPTAYVCLGFVCKLPVTDATALAAQLAA